MARRERSFSLALGSGGARGFAHVGVLDVLSEEGLRPAAVAGTSMGAFIGAMYAAGVDPGAMAAAIESLELREVAKLTAFTVKPGSLMSADRFEARAREILPASFADLQTPFACVAVDLISGEPVVMTEGDLPRSVRASMTVPVLFDPVSDGDRLLVDGVLVDPVPVEVARAMGGPPVVAVDVGPLTPAQRSEHARRGLRPIIESGRSPTVVQVGTRSLDVMTHRLSSTACRGADVVITPDVGGYFFLEMMEGQAMVEAGARAARDALPAIRDAVARSGRGALSRLWRRTERS